MFLLLANKFFKEVIASSFELVFQLTIAFVTSKFRISCGLIDLVFKFSFTYSFAIDGLPYFNSQIK